MSLAYEGIDTWRRRVLIACKGSVILSTLRWRRWMISAAEYSRSEMRDRMRISSRLGLAKITSSKTDNRPSEEMIDSLERFVWRKNVGTKEMFRTFSTFKRDTSRERRGGKDEHGNG